MSKRRNCVLPGSDCWDCFFDVAVQKVLNDRFAFTLPPPSPVTGKATPFSEWPKIAQTEFLAWPLIAYRTADGFATATTSNRRKMAEEVTDCYATDAVFFADLLAAVSRYYALPESEKSLARKVSELSPWADLASPPLDPTADDPEPVQLMDWKTIAEQIGRKNSINQLMVEFSREKTRRIKIENKWGPHFRAYWFLVEVRRQIPPPPMDFISVIPYVEWGENVRLGV